MMKEEILKLRAEGKTYNEIVEIVGCSKGTVSYHCGKNQKDKTNKRTKKYRKTAKAKLKAKFARFLGSKVHNFKKEYRGGNSSNSISYSAFYEKISKNPVCYLTGRAIDLEDTSSYQLDHIVPRAKGGKNTLSNLGLTCTEVNIMKRDLLLEDFLEICREVVKNNK